MAASLGVLFLISIMLGVLFVGALQKISSKYKLLVTRGVPLTGGIGMALAFSATMFIFLSGSSEAWLTRELWGVVWASLVLLVAGVADDIRELSVAQKFLVQTIAAFTLILFGVKTNIGSVSVTANVLFTFLWIIGITNAVNLLDVMDGLAAAVSLPILFCFSVISFLNNDVTTFVLSLTLAGAVLGFLIFNLPPAKIYMGNSGSHFLGLLLAAIALTTHYATPETKMALLSPFLILGFPIFDTAFLVLMRIKKGRSAFSKSNDHLALRYLKKGHSKGRTLLVMLVISFFFSVCGFLMSLTSNQEAIIVLIVALLVSLLLADKMNGVEI